MYVEKCSDELWLEVKCQTDSDIAGSPRNGFKASAVPLCNWGRATGWVSGGKLSASNQTPNTVATMAAS